MHILVDTCIWSQALRRNSKHVNCHANELRNLISDNLVSIIGPIRQEILSGIRTKQQFDTLRDYLSAFPDIDSKSVDYELAAEFSNRLRSKGVQGSAIDFVICAIAYQYTQLIFTIDKDFQHFSLHLPIKLYSY